MTHEYTLLLGGTVIPGGEAPDATAIAWADDTILALGGDADVRGISRGDSHVFDLRGACVVALGLENAGGPTARAAAGAAAPIAAALAIGGRADLAVLDRDPRVTVPDGAGVVTSPARTLAVVRGGRVVAGALPGATGHAPGA